VCELQCLARGRASRLRLPRARNRRDVLPAIELISDHSLCSSAAEEKMIVPRRLDGLSPLRRAVLSLAARIRVGPRDDRWLCCKRRSMLSSFAGVLPAVRSSLAGRVVRGAGGWRGLLRGCLGQTVIAGRSGLTDRRRHGFAAVESGRWWRAAQRRPEPDADLASLDPRRLGLVRWADLETVTRV
jgi:hypothetical protein